MKKETFHEKLNNTVRHLQTKVRKVVYMCSCVAISSIVQEFYTVGSFNWCCAANVKPMRKLYTRTGYLQEPGAMIHTSIHRSQYNICLDTFQYNLMPFKTK